MSVFLQTHRAPLLAAKEKFVATEQELQAYREEENLHREFDEALGSEQYLEARQWAEKLLALAHDEDQKRLWKEHVVRLQRA